MIEEARALLPPARRRLLVYVDVNDPEGVDCVHFLELDSPRAEADALRLRLLGGRPIGWLLAWLTGDAGFDDPRGRGTFRVSCRVLSADGEYDLEARAGMLVEDADDEIAETQVLEALACWRDAVAAIANGAPSISRTDEAVR